MHGSRLDAAINPDDATAADRTPIEPA